MHSKFTSAAVVALCLQGSLAAGHKRHGHSRREAMIYDNPNWMSEVNWSTVNYGAPAASATAAIGAAVSSVVSNVVPAVTSAVAAMSPAASSSPVLQSYAPSSSAGSSSNVGTSGSSGPFDTSCFGAESASQGGSGWNIVGNIGSPAGSNMAQVSGASSYQFTNSIVNNMASARTIILFNKAGEVSQTVNGVASSIIQASAGQGAASPAHQFTIAPGETVTWAFANNTQCVLCDWTDNMNSMPRYTADNAFNCPWVEMNFIDNGFSAFDVSLITQNSAGGGSCHVSVEQAGNPAKISSCTQNVFNSVSDSDTIAVAINTAQVNLVTTLE